MAMAADTADLRVVGRIIPAPCTIDLGNNGNVDFGIITAAELPSDGVRKVTGERTLPFKIACSPAGSPKVSFKDERADSVPELYERISPVTGRARMFGLGKVADKNIGIYLLHLAGVKADGEDAKLVRSADGEAPWEFIEPLELIRKDYKYVWSTTAQAQSGRFGAINGEIVIRLMPESANELPMQNEIKLDGSTTLALEYP